MKFAGLVLLALFASCKAISLEQIQQIEEDTNAKILYSPSRMAVATRAGPKLGKNTCEKNVLSFLNPNTNIIETKECKDVVGAQTGFCNCAKNKCQRTLPTNCPISPSTACDSTVYNETLRLPSESKCDEFKTCIENKLVVWKCTPPLRYNSKEQRCTSGAPCSIIRCSTTRKPTPIFVAYRPDLRFFVSCFDGISKVLKCDEGYAMDKDSCAYQCTKSGAFADPDENSSKYHVCTGPPNGPFRRIEQDCGEGQRFNNKIESCEAATTEEPTPPPGQE